MEVDCKIQSLFSGLGVEYGLYRLSSQIAKTSKTRGPALRKKKVKVINLDTEEESGFTTSSTRSYRCGVRMSDTDVPGIDLSRYDIVILTSYLMQCALFINLSHLRIESRRDGQRIVENPTKKYKTVHMVHPGSKNNTKMVPLLPTEFPEGGRVQGSIGE